MNQFSIKPYLDYQESEILPLYQSVGWTNYVNNPTLIKRAYENSLKVLVAYCDDQIVGVIRVVGDGYSIIYIQDILVLPTYQGMGIGTKLLEEILSEYALCYQKVLLTDNTPKTIAFYKKAGFALDSQMNCVTFVQFKH